MGKANLAPLNQKGIDTGMGLERLAMVSQKTNTIFETDLFSLLILKIPKDIGEKKQRVIVDHLRASAFLLADGVRVSNKGAGYILRRLLRRVLAYEHIHTFSPEIYEHILLEVIKNYGSHYIELTTRKDEIINEYWQERERFQKTLITGLRELEKLEVVDASVAFKLYESFGLPYEVIKEAGEEKTSDLMREAFEREFEKHQETSRAGQEHKFGGHGLILDTGELKAGNEEELKKVTRLHTATHLMQAALRKVLGPEVQQMGSDITAERTRFDFRFPRKVTAEELKQVEDLVNSIVKADYIMEVKVMPYEEALKTGALHFFREKYPNAVNVYSVIHKDTGEVFSRELCGGPHVSHMGEIGYFRIIKEESSSAGVRRIRATVE